MMVIDKTMLIGTIALVTVASALRLKQALPVNYFTLSSHSPPTTWQQPHLATTHQRLLCCHHLAASSQTRSLNSFSDCLLDTSGHLCPLKTYKAGAVLDEPKDAFAAAQAGEEAAKAVWVEAEEALAVAQAGYKALVDKQPFAKLLKAGEEADALAAAQAGEKAAKAVWAEAEAGYEALVDKQRQESMVVAQTLDDRLAAANDIQPIAKVLTAAQEGAQKAKKKWWGKVHSLSQAALAEH